MQSSDTCIRLAKQKDFTNILEFELNNFFDSEPTSLALGITKDAARNFCVKEVDNCLKHPISFIAVSDDGTMAGIILCSLRHASSTSRPSMQNILQQNQMISDEETKVVIPKDKEPMDMFVHYMGSLEETYSYTMPSCNSSILHIHTLCVDVVRFARCGIGMNLLEACLDNGKLLGYKVASASAISHASQNLFKKTGFRVVRRMKHSNVVDEDGRRVINCRDQTKEGQLLFKML